MKPLVDRVRALERARAAGMVALILLVIGLAGLAWIMWQGKGDAEGERDVAVEQADTGKDTLEELCKAGKPRACRAVEQIGEVPEPTTTVLDEPDPDDPEIQQPEIDDPDPDDPEIQQPERDDPPAQDGTDGAPGADSTVPGPQGEKGEPGEPATCAGEFICQGELEAILAEYAPRAWVIGLLQALGCELTGIGSELLTCTITGKP